MVLFPGPHGLYGAREDNIGRQLTIWLAATPSGLTPVPISIIPPFLCRMLFLMQPSQFNLAWDRQQICCLAYPVAWMCPVALLFLLSFISHFSSEPELTSFHSLIFLQLFCCRTVGEKSMKRSWFTQVHLRNG